MGRKTKQNNLTSPELLGQCNQSNIQLKDDFLLYLRSVQRSPKTIQQYDADLRIVMVYILQHCGNKDFHKLTKRDIVNFQNWMISENENSPARVRRVKAVMSSLSNYIENILADDEDEYAGFRPIIRKIEDPANMPVHEKTVLSDEQVEGLLKKLAQKKQYEKACAVALGAYSGRRKSELVRFKVSDFDDSNIRYGSLYKTPRKIQTKGRGANGKPLICYTLVKPFRPWLELWTQERERLGVQSEWLFPDPDNPSEHRASETLNSWAKTCSRILGVPFYWHCLRHMFTTNLSRSGVPDSVITEIIGWESADMCKTYVDIDADEMIGQYFNEDGVVQKAPTLLVDL